MTRSLRPGALAGELPRHDVRVVLHRRDQHLVAGREVGLPPAVRHQVDPLGGIAGEDDLVRMGGAEERRRLGARRLERRGGPLRQHVDAAMDVGVGALVVAGNRVEDDPRLLGGRRVVEVDERMSVRRLAQDRELGAQLRHVHRDRRGAGQSRGHAGTVAAASARSRSSRVKSVASSRPRSSSDEMSPSTSAAKAWSSRSRAWSGGSPRACR